MNSERANALYCSLGPNQFRYLVLLPGVEDDPLDCRLVEANRTSKSNHISYEALSYEWGPKQPVHTIIVSGHKVFIRQNLWAALRTIRDERFPRALWVDAVCINQENMAEKSIQVALMSSVYRNAQRVLVWLGQEKEGDSSDSTLLFEALARIEGHWDKLGTVVKTLRKAGSSTAQYTTDRIERSLVALCRRSYWTRLWIIQEIISASSLQLLCGPKRLDWRHFHLALESIISKHSGQTPEKAHPCAATPAWYIVKQCTASYVTHSFENLLKLCALCESQCEDVRDRIYGLLSVSTNQIAGIVPDYSKSAAELYLDIFLAVLTPILRARDPLPLDPKIFGLNNDTRNVLGDPLWNKDAKSFFAASDLALRSKILEMGKIYGELPVHATSKIVQVGPMITYTMKAGEDCFSPPPACIREDQDPAQIPAEVVEALQNLEPRDWHKLDAIGGMHCLQRDGNRFYTTATQSRSSTSWEPSTGHCRTFVTEDGTIGLASFMIWPGDLLCHVASMNLSFITRWDKAWENLEFMLLGPVVHLEKGWRLHDSHTSFDHYKHVPDFNMTISLATLLLLMR